MAPKVPWKSLSKENTFSTKWGTFSAKQLAFFAAAGLVLVGGLLFRSGLFSGEPEAEQKAPVTIQAPATPDATRPAPTATTTPAPSAATAPAAAPAEPVATPQPPAPQAAPAPQTAPAPETATAPSQPAEQPGEGVEQAGQQEGLGQGMILVARAPVEVLSGPSPTASVMYGFPAGRQFRVIGREGDFAQIKDLVSGASGWINEAALAPPPRAPAVSAPSQARPGAAGTKPATAAANPKSKATKKPGQTTAGSETASEPAEAPKRPGLFGGGGPFRGIFGGGN